MPEVILNCPQCQRQLRVTEELQGRPVKCPACGLTFTVPAGTTEAQPAVLMPAPSQPPTADQHGYAFTHTSEAERIRRERARALIVPPAICPVVVGLLGLLSDLYHAWVWHTAPEAQMQKLKPVSQWFSQAFNIPLPAEEKETATSTVRFLAASAVLCLVIIVLALLMIRLRWYPLAIIGSILPMVNVGSVCCCLGLPVGIWTLVVLLRPTVRDAFYSGRPV
jgi:predicted Zn finger-like uncharacterized protein